MPTKSDPSESFHCAYLGHRLIGRGSLEEVLRRCKELLSEPGEEASLPLVFDEQVGRQLDFDLSGPIEDVLARALPAPAKAGPGRPKLGVVSREVTLLPRQWEWLEQDPHGISAALRRLVDEARKRDNGRIERQQRRDAVSRLMWSVAGNLPCFEEATRALFAEDHDAFSACIEGWPGALHAHLLELTEPFFAASESARAE